MEDLQIGLKILTEKPVTHAQGIDELRADITALNDRKAASGDVSWLCNKPYDGVDPGLTNKHADVRWIIEPGGVLIYVVSGASEYKGRLINLTAELALPKGMVAKPVFTTPAVEQLHGEFALYEVPNMSVYYNQRRRKIGHRWPMPTEGIDQETYEKNWLISQLETEAAANNIDPALFRELAPLISIVSLTKYPTRAKVGAGENYGAKDRYRMRFSMPVALEGLWQIGRLKNKGYGLVERIA